jgi:sucrose phosphorylase
MRPPLSRIRKELAFLYGQASAAQAWEGVRSLLERWAGRLRPPDGVDPRTCLRQRLRLDQAACLLIAYGDQFREPGAAPLDTLDRAMTLLFHDLPAGVHVLPFFPWSSDDGFSVMDFRAVDPRLGNWEHIRRLAGRRLLMVDLVLNHASAKGAWFQGYLRGDPRYRDFFIEVPEGEDLSGVFRPRTLPLVTEFQTASGRSRLWTTFGPDQVDLNYANPAVLLEMLDVLLLYASQGAQLVRLDAVAYAWKQIGTSCLHHPKTHGLVRLVRAVLDAAAPWVLLLTETNVPQAENLSYFGDGSGEAQLVYQFPLPPLVLDAFLREESSALRAWAASLPACGPHTTYLNFLASHDGIGVLPAMGLLPAERILALAESAQERGGRVSFKSTPPGEVPYELNISYVEAVAPPNQPESVRAAAFLCSQAILLALAGVPAIYAHSLLGTPSDRDAVERTGQNRAINRRKLEYREAEALLEEAAGSVAGRVLAGMRRLLAARAGHPAFHPQAPQRVLDSEGGLFCLERVAPHGRGTVLCLHNVGGRRESFRLQRGPADEGRGSGEGFAGAGAAGWIDLISGRAVRPEPDAGGRRSVAVGPYQALWLASVPVGRPAERPLPAAPAAARNLEVRDPEVQDAEVQGWVRTFRRRSRPLHPIPAGLAPRGRLCLPVRAVLFDLYGTLWVSAAGDIDRRDAAQPPEPPGLRELLERFGCPLSPAELAVALADAIRREHKRLRAEGADVPEVRIEQLWAERLGLDLPRARAFAVEYEALVNPVWPMPGLRAMLDRLRQQGLLLGILSNAQFYTPCLFDCFLGAGPEELGFREELVMYSFRHGLAKPSPRLFGLARTRLQALGVPPNRVLMVGNDAPRDLAPAGAAGFQTALFAGDARSLRRAEAPGAEREATVVITDLRQLPRLLASGRVRARSRAVPR